MAFQMAGLYDKAIEELQMALTLNPHFFFMPPISEPPILQNQCTQGGG